jgi:hypothetical protein
MLPIDLQALRRRLYAKAKAEPSWRFWGLSVRVCKMETLQAAYKLAKENNGAPGIAGVTFDSVESGGARGVSRATARGAGLRPNKSAHDAVERVRPGILQRRTRVIDLDLRSCFDPVRHHFQLDHGLVLPSLSAARVTTVPEQDLGIASAANRFTSSAAAAFGITLLTLLYPSGNSATPTTALGSAFLGGCRVRTIGDESSGRSPPLWISESRSFRPRKLAGVIWNSGLRRGAYLNCSPADPRGLLQSDLREFAAQPIGRRSKFRIPQPRLTNIDPTNQSRGEEG